MASQQAGVPFLGSKITLISKTAIRYEGTLFNIDPKNNSIALKDVKMFGTEGRVTDQKPIPALDKVFEYITFKGDDIRDLTVSEAPQQQVPQKATDAPTAPQPSARIAPKAQEGKQSQEAKPPQQQQQPGQPAAGLPPQQGDPLAATGNQGGLGPKDGANGQHYNPYFNPYMPNPYMGPYGWTGQAGGPMGMNPQQMMPYGYPYGYSGFDPYQQAQQVQEQPPLQRPQQQMPQPADVKQKSTEQQTQQQQQQQQQPSTSPNAQQKELLLLQPTEPSSREGTKQAAPAPKQQTVDKHLKEQRTAPETSETPQQKEVQKPLDGPKRTTDPVRGGRRRGTHTKQEEKYRNEFDFESANAQFDKLAIKEELGKDDEDHVNYYDKSKSFFDNLTVDPSKGASRSRQERDEQKKLDYETFGTTSTGRRYGGRGGRGRGNRGRGGQRGRGGGRSGAADIHKA